MCGTHVVLIFPVLPLAHGIAESSLQVVHLRLGPQKLLLEVGRIAVTSVESANTRHLAISDTAHPFQFIPFHKLRDTDNYFLDGLRGT